MVAFTKRSLEQAPAYDRPHASCPSDHARHRGPRRPPARRLRGTRRTVAPRRRRRRQAGAERRRATVDGWPTASPGRRWGSDRSALEALAREAKRMDSTCYAVVRKGRLVGDWNWGTSRLTPARSSR